MCFTFGASGGEWGIVATDSAIQLLDDNGVEIPGFGKEGDRWRVEPVGGRLVWDGVAFSGMTGAVRHWHEALERHAETGEPVRLGLKDTERPTRHPASRLLQVFVGQEKKNPVVLRIDHSVKGVREVRRAWDGALPHMEEADRDRLVAWYRATAAKDRDVFDAIRTVAHLLDEAAKVSRTVTDDLHLGLLISDGELAGAHILREKASRVATAPTPELWSMFELVGASHAREEWERVAPLYERLGRERVLRASAQFNEDGEFNGHITVNALLEADRFLAEHIVVEGSIEIQDGTELSLVEISALGDAGNVYVNSNDVGSHFGWFGAATGGSFLSSSGFLELSPADELRLALGGNMSITGLPTSNPGGTNRVWADGSGFLRIT